MKNSNGLRRGNPGNVGNQSKARHPYCVTVNSDPINWSVLAGSNDAREAAERASAHAAPGEVIHVFSTALKHDRFYVKGTGGLIRLSERVGANALANARARRS